MPTCVAYAALFKTLCIKDRTQKIKNHNKIPASLVA